MTRPRKRSQSPAPKKGVEMNDTIPVTKTNQLVSQKPVAANAKPDVDEYLASCRACSITPDPNVIICLRTRWKTLELAPDASLLPLMSVLSRNGHVENLKLSGSCQRTGKANARALRHILAHNTALVNLNCYACGFDAEAIAELCAGLAENTSVKTLDVGGNDFGEDESSCVAMQATINQHISLEEVNMSNLCLGYKQITLMTGSTKASVLRGLAEGNFMFEEILNAMTHGVGIPMVAVGAFLLGSRARERTITHCFGVGIFLVSLLMMYSASTLYHSFFLLGRKTLRIFQILDHAAIYILIAGSYTPFLLIAMHSTSWGTTFLIAQWSAALLGILFHLFSNPNDPTAQVVELVFYAVMGCAVFFIWEDFSKALPSEAVGLVVAGGAAYLSGIVFFILGNTVPIYHAVWHVFVLTGSVCHFLCIYHYVVVIDIHGPQVSYMPSIY